MQSKYIQYKQSQQLQSRPRLEQPTRLQTKLHARVAHESMAICAGLIPMETIGMKRYNLTPISSKSEHFENVTPVQWFRKLYCLANVTSDEFRPVYVCFL